MEGISVPRIIEIDDLGDINESDRYDTRNVRTRKRHTDHRTRPTEQRNPHPSRRADGQESFKCGHCKAFIGPTVSGGRHRNHCPLCLYSRHVDDRYPGDRASRCRSLMAPVGTFHRPKGEQVIVHRCLGCGIERHNRVAADDNMIACLRLPPLAPRIGGRTTDGAGKEEEAIA
jgi:hypothetical protein